MHLHNPRWGKALFWGSVTALFYYGDLIIHMAHTTPPACVVGHGAEDTSHPDRH